MAKLTLSDIDNESVPSASATISANNAELESWSDTVLSRDGSSPNQMEADLDMNSNRILNLPAARSSVNTDVVRVGDLVALVAELGVEGPPGPTGDGTGDMLKTNNLSDVANVATSRANLGLEIGVDVLAYNDYLQDVADLTLPLRSFPFKDATSTVVSFQLAPDVITFLESSGIPDMRSGLNLGDSALLDVGKGASTVAAGNDSRFTKLDIETVNSSASFSLSQAGRLVRHTSASAHAYTIDPVGTTAYPVGTVIQVRNAVGGGDVTLTRGAGVALYRSGATSDANVTLSAGGLCTLVHEAEDVWVVGGTGLS